MPNPTENQDRFVTELVASGCNPTEAARRAGYAHPAQESYKLIRLPHIQEAIRNEQTRSINGDLVNKSLRTLHAVMDDGLAPASAKVAAARAGLEAAGVFARSSSEGKAIGERNGDGDKPLIQMTEAELQEVVVRLRHQREVLEAAQPRISTAANIIDQ